MTEIKNDRIRPLKAVFKLDTESIFIKVEDWIVKTAT